MERLGIHLDKDNKSKIMKEKLDNSGNNQDGNFTSNYSKVPFIDCDKIVPADEQAEKSNYVDSLLKNLQIGGLESTENQINEKKDFIKANTIKKGQKNQSLSLKAAIHLGFLLSALGIASITNDVSSNQIFIAISLIFAAMAAQYLNNQTVQNHE